MHIWEFLLLLQETHLRAPEEKHLKHFFKDQPFHAPVTTNPTKGVLIDISAQLVFKMLAIEQDREGRFIIVQGCVEGEQIMLLNIYAPNDNQFFSSK